VSVSANRPLWSERPNVAYAKAAASAPAVERARPTKMPDWQFRTLLGEDAQRLFLLGESIKSLCEEFVQILEATALDSFPHPSFELGQMDFDVH